MDPLIGIILVNYKGIDDCCECVESIYDSTYKRYQIYIVNNDVDCKSVEELTSRIGARATVINVGQNVGFGAANNIGFNVAVSDGCDYLLALNNDTLIDPEMISVLESVASEKTIAVPLILYHDNRSLVWYAGGKFNLFGIPKHLSYRRLRTEVSLERKKVTFATGCCFLMHKSIYTSVGGFDQDYFLYWEDADLSIRWLRAGYTIELCPKAVVFHKVSSSTGGEGSPRTYYYETRNRLRAIKKLHLGLRTYLWAYLSLLRGMLSDKTQYQFAKQVFSDYRNNRFGEMGENVRD